MQKSVIVPPSFVVPGRDLSAEMKESVEILAGVSEGADEIVKASLELYARQMLSTCALRLEIPAPLLPVALSPKRINEILPPSIANRIKFIDRSGSKWNAIQKYLEPIFDDTKGIATPKDQRDPESITSELISHVYSISLSISNDASAIAPPYPMIDLIEWLEGLSLSSESYARLAILKGIAACFERHEQIPGLTCKPQLSEVLSEQIDEILEDAYLLEASRLRTFFSPAANWASLRRDLRKTLGWLVRNRRWARRAVQLGEQVVAVPGSTIPVTDALAEIGLTLQETSCPVLLEETHTAWTGNNTVIQVKYPGAIALFQP